MVEQHQRNSILKGLKNCNENDLIILSDVDEIPDLTKLNKFNKKNKYAVFSQKAFAYKLNLFNKAEDNWHGSKMCLKKDLKSPQWLRNLKFKKYPFWRIDKPRKIQIIENGGWDFAYLLKPEGISKKIQSFAHGEDNKKDNTDIDNLDKLYLVIKQLCNIINGDEVKKHGLIKKIRLTNEIIPKDIVIYFKNIYKLLQRKYKKSLQIYSINNERFDTIFESQNELLKTQLSFYLV